MIVSLKIRVAILDDYEGIAAAKFSHLSSQIKVDNIPDTLSPGSSKDLVHRLLPYHVISTMRERRAFPADVIYSLPNLKLILTTGMKNSQPI